MTDCLRQSGLPRSIVQDFSTGLGLFDLIIMGFMGIMRKKRNQNNTKFLIFYFELSVWN